MILKLTDHCRDSFGIEEKNKNKSKETIKVNIKTKQNKV